MVVLVVDDDAVSRLVIEHILKNGGHETVTVDSAEQAETTMATSADAVELIVCDYVMPGASGLDLLETLAARLDIQMPPFVLLTGISDASDLDDARVEHVAGYLTKPVQSTELLDLVTSLTEPS